MRSFDELFDLRGRVAVVTGGAGHIGFACAEVLAERGAAVLIADRDSTTSEARAKDLTTRFHTDAAAVVMDLENVDEGAQTVVQAAHQRFGRLDVLVNNAAYTGSSEVAGWSEPFEHQSLDAWNAAIAVNLSAPFRIAQAAFPLLAKEGHGAIINVGSIYGLVGPRWSLYEGTRMSNPAGYGATKGGLVQLTRYLATVMAPSVRVNCLAPGGVARGQPEVFVKRYEENTPLKRMAVEEDFKGAFAFLASEASAYVTGQVLVVDGGWTAW